MCCSPERIVHLDLLWLVERLGFGTIVYWNLVAVLVILKSLRWRHWRPIVLEWVRASLNWGSSSTLERVVDAFTRRSSRGWLGQRRNSTSWLRSSVST